ncbi:uncharacterized protein [Diadema setosum]|uniref:uncharacterized protein n=1 Tax=Diadema setosum TaxID=31175 RepID=UPI003B3B1522
MGILGVNDFSSDFSFFAILLVITCEGSALPSPINGGKNGCPLSSERYGTQCTLYCDVGYQPLQPVTRTCLADDNDKGYWSDNGTITCSVVKCTPLPEPENGFVLSCTLEGNSVNVTALQEYNSRCQTACNNGYTPLNSATRRCLEDGTWDGIDQICEDNTPPTVYCPSDQILIAGANKLQAIFTGDRWEPVLAHDGDLQFEAYLYQVDSQVVDGGNVPTTLWEGDHTLVYKATDVAGNSATCSFGLEVRVTRCSALYPPGNGDVALIVGQGTCQGGAVFGSECRVFCDEGYLLSVADEGDEESFTLTCNRTDDTTTVGTWSDTTPQCDLVQCQIPPVTNGTVSGCPSGSAEYGDECLFRCDDGFQSSSGKRSVYRACQADGTFSGDGFHCDVPIICAPLSVPTDGSLSPESCSEASQVPYGTTCLYACDTGFLHDGPFQKTCLSTGTWNDNRDVTCRDNQAPVFDLPCPLYMDYNADRGISSAVIDINTPNATDNSGDSVVQLTSSIPDNNRFLEGTTRITYAASDAANNRATCDIYVRVTVKRCQQLQTPHHGSVVNCSSDLVYGTQCSFTCNEGYELSGPTQRTCELTDAQGSAYWDGTQPTCEPRTCPAYPVPDNGIRSGCTQDPPNTENYGTQCILYCPYGYEGVGDNLPRCQADGTWTSQDFSCNATSCNELQPPAGGTVIPADCMSSPVFGQQCVVSCDRSGYRLQPSNFAVLECQGNGQWTPGDLSQVTCTDIEAPNFISCPGDETVHPERGEVRANVTWNVTAVDNSGEDPVVSCDQEVGEMDEGDLRVSCTAEDAAGNRRTCSFEVSVDVRRCSSYLLPARGSFEGSCDTHWGSTCHVTCAPGYHLTGSSNVTCEFDGTRMYWAEAEAPMCEAYRCNPLELPMYVSVSPATCAGSSQVQVGTSCTPYCPNGRTLEGDGGPTVCGSDGQWSRYLNSSSNIACRDLTAPTLTSCPAPITATQTESWGVEVVFDVPSAIDSADTNLEVLTSPPDLISPYNFTGDTLCIYTFTDDANNSVSCQFHVYVQDDLVPVLVYCPPDQSLLSSEQTTTVSWDAPIFEEVTGDELSISSAYDNHTGDFMYGDHLVEYTATNTDNGRATTCSFTISVQPVPCMSLDPPINGALACDGWTHGTFCSILCQERYDIPRNSPSVPELYVCGSSGIWQPHSIVPDCTETRRGNRVTLPSSLQYFSGSCGSSETNTQIAEAFLQLLEQSFFYSETCTPDVECSVEYVEVTCGPSNGGARRKRRSTEETSGRRRHSRPSTTKRRKRTTDVESSDYVFTISFGCSMEISQNDSTSNFDSAYEGEGKLIDHVDQCLEDDLLNFSNLSSTINVTLTVDEDSFDFEIAELVCDPGFTVDNEDYNCIPCGSGFHFDNTTKNCTQCEIGSYQSKTAQFTCDQCPDGQSTLGLGTKNITHCIDICKPGFASMTGLEPCYICGIGTYQNSSYSTECNQCPEGMTTRQIGSNSSDHCIEPCKAGEFSESGFVPCSPCPVGSYQSLAQRTQCIPCPNNTTTRHNGTTSPTQCISACDYGPCLNGGFCISEGIDYSCTCQAGYSGKNCQIDIDECSSDPCANGATCSDFVDGFQCTCVTGYEGMNCESEIDNCISTPCENNAPCASVLGDFECSCPSGFSGKNCSIEVDLCAGDPCKNGATCSQSQQAVMGYVCQCAPGYRGVNCSMNIDECQSSPCLNLGSCIDGVNSYTCNCPFGFSGSRCEEDVDLCANVTCQNNGTCTEIGNGTFCACAAKFSGEFCQEEITACSGVICENGGTCSAISESSFEYSCRCLTGYTGLHCEVDVDFCQSEPCLNGATCIDGNTNFTCECHSGFTGSVCGDYVDWCAEAPCGVNSECVNGPQGIQCLCEAGWTGQYCLDEFSLCDELEPCNNGSTCTGDHANFVCHCPPGYQGSTCHEEINNCSSAPCLNGGTCIRLVESYECQCVDGFTGANCEININDCTGSLCQHGTCTDGIDSYTCECEVGYTGTHCETDIRCTDSPCRNNATSCYIDRRRPRCICAAGFTGRTCQSEINECGEQPCIEAIKCIDGINSFTCVCKDGFTGTLCDTRVSTCQSSPSICQNGGTCHDRLDGGYSCQCLLGFDGNNCENNIDDCVTNDCENGGTCVDGVHEYTCECAEGTSGTYCQLSANPCDSTPCRNGGQCDPIEDGFVCHCLPGFTGETCNTNVDDCQDHHNCSGGSTCNDLVNGYQCICPDGKTGEYCNEDIDECESNPCQNGGTCVDGNAIGYTCLCLNGYGGRDCEKEVDECASFPCANLGVCTDGINSFECACLEGYRGVTCEERISSCESNPCMYNGSCTDGLIQFVCSCPRGFTGERCETEILGNFDLTLDQRLKMVNHSVQTEDDHQNLTLSVWMLVDVPAPSENLRLLRLSAGNFTVALYNPCSLTLMIGRESYNSNQSSLCDNRWHHVFLWFDIHGQWEWRVDGSELLANHSAANESSMGEIIDVTIGSSLLNNGKFHVNAFNLWSGIVGDDLIPVLQTKCNSSASGNVITWTDFTGNEAFTLVAKFPSQCDDTNECLLATPSPPCQNGGTCVDQLNSYMCLCPEYLTGKNCDEEVDLCTNTTCQNGGSCTTLNRTTSCECSNVFKGPFCEVAIIHGNWSEWTEWSPCSESCGGGIWNRTRECTNPPPNEHGMPCEGHDFEEEACNTQKCPACLTLKAPENGTLECEMDGEAYNCTASCPEGLDFVGEVHSFYVCSPSTNYVWSHQLDLNIKAKLPSCQEISKPNEVTANISLPYPSAQCSSEQDENTLKVQLTSAFSNSIGNFGCSSNNHCSISNIDMNGETIDPDAGGVVSTVTIICPAGQGYTARGNCVGDLSSCESCPRNTYQDQEGQRSVRNAPMVSLQQVLRPSVSQSASFPVPWVTTKMYGLTLTTQNQSALECPLNAYQDRSGQQSCIPCPAGYVTLTEASSNISDCVVICEAGFYVDVSNTSNPRCLPCPVNSYLDQSGHQEEECIPCPDDLVTKGNGSANITDCIVACGSGSYFEVQTLMCLPCPPDTYQNLHHHLEEACMPCPTGMVTIGNASTNHHECMNPEDSTVPPVPEGKLYTIIIVGTCVAGVVLLVVIIGVGVIVKKTSSLNKPYFLRSATVTPSPEPSENSERSLNEEGHILMSLTSFNEMDKEHEKDKEEDFQSPQGPRPYTRTPVEPFQNTNECLLATPSPPCQNGGTCVDQLNSYMCLCPEYLTGKNCDEEVDLCTNTTCQNGGSCTTLNRTTSCECSNVFKGPFCEVAIIHGNWSEWTEWSPCSESCGGGIWNRTRECTNPPPNEHGMPCEGHDFEEEACNTQKCPGPGEWNLGVRDGRRSVQLHRQLSRGLDFVGEVHSFYVCSPSTNYVWSHQLDLNIKAKLPSCQEISKPNEVTANISLPYPSAQCSSEQDENTLKVQLTSAFSNSIGNFGCSSNNHCSISNIDVENCVSRRRRATDDEPVTLAVEATFNYTNTEESDQPSVDEMSETLNTLMSNGSLSLEIDGETIDPDAGGVVSTVTIICPAGQGYTARGNCVICPAGTYYTVVGDLSSCESCPRNTYQDQEGQAECKECPHGLITASLEAVSITECIVPCPEGNYQDVWVDVDNPEPVCVECPLNAYQDRRGQQNCIPCPAGYVTLTEASSNISDCVVICEAGFYVDVSNTSNPQCLPCPVDSYLDQSGHQEQECIPCPDGLVTKGNGSANITDCIVACGSGSYFEVQTLMCLPCPPDTYQNLHHHLEEACMPCPTGMVTIGNASTNHHECMSEWQKE